MKRGLLICGIVAAGLLVIGAIGSTGDDKEAPVSEPTSASTTLSETVKTPDVPAYEEISVIPADPAPVEEITAEIITETEITETSDTTASPISVDESGTITIPEEHTPASGAGYFDISAVPAFSGKPYVTVNNNVPYFTEADYTSDGYEYYGPLDDLGRCSYAIANVCKELMPTEERGSIGQIKPTGWHTVR